MRKLFLMLTLVALGTLAFGAGGAGNSGRLAVVNDAESGKVKVIYKSEEAGKVELRLLDGEGNKLYSATLKSSGGFILPMNFSNLEDGEYTFELTDAAGKIIESIQYGGPSDEGMQLRVTRIEDSKYAVMLSHARAGKVQIRFLDEQGKVVYDLEEEISGEFGKLFTFKEHPIQVASVEVSDSRGSTTTLVN
jgi:hypothetical protein